MADERTLKVMFKESSVGFLKQDSSGQMEFIYPSLWLDSDDSWPISRTLPLESGPADKKYAHKFFGNLLPEGRVRHAIAQRLGISEENDFALLEAVGGECAGALRIVPFVNAPDSDELDEYLPISMDELVKTGTAGMLYPAYAHRGKMRLSLAGAQDKLPVLCHANELFLPQGNLASSHILKFPNRDFKYLPENEVLTMRLAGECGLPVVETELLQSGKFRVCKVKRYDRVVSEGSTGVWPRLERIHQEDFCQALGYSRHMKYEQEGGPTFAECFLLAEEFSSNPLADIETLVKWHIFNLIAGNADGHAKNLAILYANNRQVRLAPLYDIVSTATYPSLDRRMAMATGGNDDPGQLVLENWKKMADQTGVTYAMLIEQIESMAERVSEKAPEVFKRFVDEYGETPAIERIRGVLDKRIRGVMRSLR